MAKSPPELREILEILRRRIRNSRGRFLLHSCFFYEKIAEHGLYTIISGANEGGNFNKNYEGGIP